MTPHNPSTVSEGVKQAITKNVPEANTQNLMEQANAANDDSTWVAQMTQLQEQMNQIQQTFPASQQPSMNQPTNQGWQNSMMPPPQQYMQQ